MIRFDRWGRKLFSDCDRPQTEWPTRLIVLTDCASGKKHTALAFTRWRGGAVNPDIA
jgi:hypothetical protein